MPKRRRSVLTAWNRPIAAKILAEASLTVPMPRKARLAEYTRLLKQSEEYFTQTPAGAAWTVMKLCSWQKLLNKPARTKLM